MKIAMACDHGAVELKNKLKAHLQEKGMEVVDFGTHTTDSCDYPDYIAPAAQAVASGECDRGIVLCTTGIGVAIVAHQNKGLRCPPPSRTRTPRPTPGHNAPKTKALGAGVTGPMLAQEIVDVWLATDFSHSERHQRRIDKVMALEKL